MAHLINQERAVEFRQSIADPIVRAMVTHGHRIILIENSEPPDADFDMLFFSRVLEIFFRDREKLAKELQGDIEPDPFLGED